MRKKAPPKPRNPFVQHLVQRSGGGLHVKSHKAQRARDKAQLRAQARTSAKLVENQ